VAQFRDLEDDTSVAAFLAYPRAAAEHERGLDQATPGGSETVKLLTVHAAKGLEWDVVVLPNVSAGIFPSRRGRSKWTSSGKVLPSPLRGDRAWMPALANWSATAVREFAAACKQHRRWRNDSAYARSPGRGGCWWPAPLVTEPAQAARAVGLPLRAGSRLRGGAR
jgi:hypothetical protein